VCVCVCVRVRACVCVVACTCAMGYTYLSERPKRQPMEIRGITNYFHIGNVFSILCLQNTTAIKVKLSFICCLHTRSVQLFIHQGNLHGQDDIVVTKTRTSSFGMRLHLLEYILEVRVLTVKTLLSSSVAHGCNNSQNG